MQASFKKFLDWLTKLESSHHSSIQAGIGIYLLVYSLGIPGIIYVDYFGNDNNSGTEVMEYIGAVAASITAGIFLVLIGYLIRGVRYKKAVLSAPQTYVKRLERLIRTAYEEGPTNARINAAAIVSVTKNMKESLITIASYLNTEITAMDGILNPGEEIHVHAEKGSKEKHIKDEKELNNILYQYISILNKTWPEKKVVIEIQIRKLLSELGLEKA